VNKTELRKTYLSKRSELDPATVEELSRRIVRQFEQLSFQAVQLVHIFYPIAGRHEFNSLLLKDYLRTRFPAARFVLPKTDTQSHILTNILWEEDTALAINKWGITEPERGKEIPATDIDVIIVPLLAYDKKGNRLGYGKGFYDRFLAQCRADALKIGVSFFPPEDQFQEVDPLDISLSICVTPENVWYFNTLNG
jgi:5-formyltetrahydrofolate cyclo-ligase